MRIDWDWWNISIFFVIPILSVLFFYLVKKKMLWLAPIISTVISIAVSAIAMPTIISYSEHRAMFFMIVIPAHIIITVIMTVIAYVIAYIFKQKRR